MEKRKLLLVLVVFIALLIMPNGKSELIESQSTNNMAIPSQNIEVKEIKESNLINVRFINQREKYPTGCESVSAVMALQHFGIDVTPEEFIDHYLEKGPSPYMKDGKLWGSNPWKRFPGSPYDLTGYGCYAPVIYKALSALLQDKEYCVQELYNVPIQELCEKYIQNDIPVILWASINMKTLKNTKTWFDLDTKELITWKSPEHCLLLTGYDQEFYYFNDPMRGQNIPYQKESVHKAYRELYSQAIVIIPSHKEAH